MTNEGISQLRTGLKKMVIRECNVKNVEPTQIGDSAPIIGGAGPLVLDSLDAVEIVAALERNFGLKVEDAGAARSIIKNFEAMSDYVVRNAPSERVELFLEFLVTF